MNLSRSIWMFCLVAFVFPLAATAVDVVDDSKTVPYLFTLAAKSGTLKGDMLTLEGVNMVVYFADRPVRKAGHLSLEEFVNMWDKGEDNFNVDPPSAELAINKKDDDIDAISVLEQPKVEGDNITFKVKAIAVKIPESFGHATLFIDSLGIKKSPGF